MADFNAKIEKTDNNEGYYGTVGNHDLHMKRLEYRANDCIRVGGLFRINITSSNFLHIFHSFRRIVAILNGHTLYIRQKSRV